MKKTIIIALILFVAAFAFSAEVAYQNTSGVDFFYNGDLIEASDTIVYNSYVYVDGLTLTAATPSALILAYTEVSTTAAATTTVMVDELADVTIKFDTDYPDSITLYFNSVNTTPITLNADWEYDANTAYFDRLIIKNTATTTAYDVLITRKF